MAASLFLRQCAEPYARHCVAVGMTDTNWKPARPSPVEHIGKVLRETIEGLRREPLPERWIRLIEHLNAEEDALNERTRRELRGS